jgi:hypothetical protein
LLLTSRDFQQGYLCICGFMHDDGRERERGGFPSFLHLLALKSVGGRRKCHILRQGERGVYNA